MIMRKCCLPQFAAFLLLCLCLCLFVKDTYASPSQQCQEETKNIESYQNASGAILQESMWMALHKNVEAHVYSPDDCNYTSTFEFSCKIVYEGDNETLAPFYELCDLAGGKVAKRVLDIKSNFLGLWSFNVTMTDIPQCVGKSCNPATLERGDLPNPIFDIFVANMEVGDICKQKGDSWGEISYWTSFAFDVASWGGMDLGDCFTDEGEEDERERYLRGSNPNPAEQELIDVFAGPDEDEY